VLVQTVAEGSQADLLGLREGSIPVTMGDNKLLLGGDIIASVAGISLKGHKSIRSIQEKVRQMTPGTPISFNIFRAGEFITLTSDKL
jgi:S1-C subfamily serine protease